MLGRGNLTSREKFLLLVQNEISRMKTGEEILTPADQEVLENWEAKTGSEAKEWNRLNEGWKHFGKMEIETEFIFKDAQVAHLAQLPFILKLMEYPIDRKAQGCVETLKQLKKVTINEAIQIAAKQRAVKLWNGMDFDYAAYKLSFELLSPKDRQQMNELYPDVETDEQYLDQEEIIANLYGGKHELSKKAKLKLSKLVAEKSYNKFAKEYQLFHYFACIPLVEIGRRFLQSKGIEVGKKDENREEGEDSSTSEDVTKALEAYASKHGETIQTLLEEGCFTALNDGILTEYTPLVISDSAKLFKRWLSKKVEAKSMLMKHVEKGELILRKRTAEETFRDKLYSKGLYESEIETAKNVLENMGVEYMLKSELDEKVAFEKFAGAVIIGESLYELKADYEFLGKFKKRVDTYDPNLGLVYEDSDPEHKGKHLDRELLICSLTNNGETSFFSIYGMTIDALSTITEKNAFFLETIEDGKRLIRFKDAELEKTFRLRRNDVISGYAKLLAFEDIFKRLSREYEVDLTYHVFDRIKSLRNNMELLNESIRIATNTEEKNSQFGMFRRKEMLEFKEALIIDIVGIKPDFEVTHEHEERLKGILGSF